MHCLAPYGQTSKNRIENSPWRKRLVLTSGCQDSRDFGRDQFEYVGNTWLSGLRESALSKFFTHSCIHALNDHKQSQNEIDRK